MPNKDRPMINFLHILTSRLKNEMTWLHWMNDSLISGYRDFPTLAYHLIFFPINFPFPFLQTFSLYDALIVSRHIIIRNWFAIRHFSLTSFRFTHFSRRCDATYSLATPSGFSSHSIWVFFPLPGFFAQQQLLTQSPPAYALLPVFE